MNGMTLIDCMIAVAVLSIGAHMLVTHFDQYERASRRAIAVEGVARVLDQELERMRACSGRVCIEALATGTTSVAAVAFESESWVRARVRRTIEAGPSGTVKVIVGASVPGVVDERRIAALLRVE